MRRKVWFLFLFCPHAESQFIYVTIFYLYFLLLLWFAWRFQWKLKNINTHANLTIVVEINTGFTQILISNDSNHHMFLSLPVIVVAITWRKRKGIRLYFMQWNYENHRVRSNCQFCCVVDNSVYNEGDGTSKPSCQINICINIIECDVHYCSHYPNS